MEGNAPPRRLRLREKLLNQSPNAAARRSVRLNVMNGTNFINFSMILTLF